MIPDWSFGFAFGCLENFGREWEEITVRPKRYNHVNVVYLQNKFKWKLKIQIDIKIVRNEYDLRHDCHKHIVCLVQTVATDHRTVPFS